MRLTSNNAPEVRDLIATVMVSMINGATRFRHFDRLRANAWTEPLAITVVDGAGAPVKGKAYLSGGVLKFDTTTGTALILR